MGGSDSCGGSDSWGVRSERSIAPGEDRGRCERADGLVEPGRTSSPYHTMLRRLCRDIAFNLNNEYRIIEYMERPCKKGSV